MAYSTAGCQRNVTYRRLLWVASVCVLCRLHCSVLARLSRRLLIRTQDRDVTRPPPLSITVSTLDIDFDRYYTTASPVSLTDEWWVWPLLSGHGLNFAGVTVLYGLPIDLLNLKAIRRTSSFSYHNGGTLSIRIVHNYYLYQMSFSSSKCVKTHFGWRP